MKIAKFVESRFTKEFLLTLIKSLLEDNNDSVKIYAVQSSLEVAKAVDDSAMLRECVLPSFKTSASNRYSWRLRFAVAETAAELSKYLELDAIDNEILSIYELLMRDNEPEVRSEAVAKLPFMAKNCTQSLLIEKIIPIIKEQIANDASNHVKGSMAQGICDLSDALSTEQILEHVVPPILKIMQDSSTDVRISLMKNIAKLAKNMGEEQVEQVIIPEI